MIKKLKKIPKFFGELREELKKVVWTKKEELSQTAIVVIFILIFFTIYIFTIDLGLSKIVETFFR